MLTPVFEMKLRSIQFKEYIPHYRGENEPKEILKFFRKSYESKNLETTRRLVFHVTTGTGSGDLR